MVFDPVGDYDTYVDGQARADGTRAFLAARGIQLPEGRPDDAPHRHQLGRPSAGTRLRPAAASRGTRPGLAPSEGAIP